MANIISNEVKMLTENSDWSVPRRSGTKRPLVTGVTSPMGRPPGVSVRNMAGVSAPQEGAH